MSKFYLIGKKTLIVIFTICFSINAFSQIKLDEQKAAQFAQEVFLNCSQYTTPQHLEIYKKEIHRIEIIKSTDLKETVKTIYNINTLTLKNKCNSSLQYDKAANFIPENFNPLKYFFPNNNTAIYYKIEGSDYVIRVNPLIEDKN